MIQTKKKIKKVKVENEEVEDVEENAEVDASKSQISK